MGPLLPARGFEDAAGPKRHPGVVHDKTRGYLRFANTLVGDHASVDLKATGPASYSVQLFAASYDVAFSDGAYQAVLPKLRHRLRTGCFDTGPCSTPKTDASGSWYLVPSAAYWTPVDLTIKQSGSKVSGTWSSASYSGLLDSGKRQGDTLVLHFHNPYLHLRDGTITTVAGIGNPGGMYACTGDGGPATSAQIDVNGGGLALDSEGNLYFSSGCSKVRRVGTDGIITTVAGTGVTGYGGDGGPATAAQLNGPAGLAVDKDGNLYIVDSRNYRIRRVGTDGNIVTVAGTGVSGYSGDGGLAINAKLYEPWGAAVDDNGNLYVSGGRGIPRVRRISPDGIITRYAGTGYRPYSGYPGDDGGLAVNARLESAIGLSVDRRGNLYIATGTAIRMVNLQGIIKSSSPL